MENGSKLTWSGVGVVACPPSPLCFALLVRWLDGILPWHSVIVWAVEVEEADPDKLRAVADESKEDDVTDIMFSPFPETSDSFSLMLRTSWLSENELVVPAGDEADVGSELGVKVEIELGENVNELIYFTASLISISALVGVLLKDINL